MEELPNKAKRSPLSLSRLQTPINTPKFLKRYVFNRAPTSSDYKNFEITDEWVKRDPTDTISPYGVYMLVDKTASSGTWISLAGSTISIDKIIADDGYEVEPNENNAIFAKGGSSVATSGSGSELTISSTVDPHALVWTIDTTILSDNVLTGEGRIADNGAGSILYTISGDHPIGSVMGFVGNRNVAFEVTNPLGYIMMGNTVVGPTEKITSPLQGDIFFLLCTYSQVDGKSFTGYGPTANFTKGPL